MPLRRLQLWNESTGQWETVGDPRLTDHLNDPDGHPSYLTQAEADARYMLAGAGGAVDSALRTYVQQIMAELDPTGPPPP